MLDFQPFALSQKAEYERFLLNCGERGCEYNFSNLYLWGRQRAAFHNGNLAFFSQFNRKSVYPFPLGTDLKPTLDAIIHDAKMRGIPCRWNISALLLEKEPDVCTGITRANSAITLTGTVLIMSILFRNCPN